MYQQPWGQQQQDAVAQPQQGGAQQQPWGLAQPVGAAAAYAAALAAQAAVQQQQQQQQQGAQQQFFAAPAGGGAAADSQAANAAAYLYYQQQAAAAAASQHGAQQADLQGGGPPGASSYYPGHVGPTAGAGTPPGPAPGGIRTWTGTVTQIIPPNYGVVDGDAYYINAVVIGDVPNVGEKVVAEGVPNAEGSYKWRITRLQSESAAAAAAAQAAAAAAAQRASYAAASAGSHGPSRPMLSRNMTEEERRKLREEAAKKTYNNMAPPMAAYKSEVAMASVETALSGATATTQPQVAAGLAEKRALIARGTAEMDEGMRKKAEQTVQQLGMDVASNPGAMLLAKMGFGTSGTGLGRNQQGISAPVEATIIKPGSGLGFDFEKEEEEQRQAREARNAAREARERERRERESHRRRPPSRSRSRSPSRRYACSPPKWPTYETERAVATLSKRYKDLYLPSDFVKVRPTWQQSCPETNPYPIDRPISFDFKDTDSAKKSPSAKATPTAASVAGLSEEDVASGRLWSAKVVLVGGVDPLHLQAGEKESKMWHNPAKKLNFVLIKHDKREYGMVGGGWDPQDGGHPARDPTALSRTAMRHFKAATGLDLSGCTQWAPFCEYVYHRPESSSKGMAGRTEHTMVYLVDAWSLATHDSEAEALLQKAKSATETEEHAKQELAQAEARLKELEEAAKVAAEKAAATNKDAGGLDFEGLDPPNMNVQQLQEELTKRGLDTKWNPLKGKKELVDRLQEWIQEHRTKRAAEDADFRASEEAKAALEAQKEQVRDKDKTFREARSAVRSAEKLLLDPPPTEKLQLQAAGDAVDKKGRSMLSNPSLDALLDYDDDDYGEHGFEVTIFAELFQEMLQQRFGRAILRALGTIEPSKTVKRTGSRRDDKDGKGPSSASKKRERDMSTEPFAATQGGDKGGEKDKEGVADMVDAEKPAVGAGADAKRQKTDTEAAGSATQAAAAPTGYVENLLTACRYYDRDLAGYLADEDLEEIAYMVSDTHSRKGVQTLVDGVTKRGKFSYLEHAGVVVPPAALPTVAAASAAGGGSDSAVTSDSGVVIIHGAAINVPVLQQRLAALDAAKRAAEDAHKAAEKEKADALADKQKAQDLHEQAVLELAQTKQQLQQLASTRSQTDMDASKARVALQAAKLSLQELQQQVSEAVVALGGGPQAEAEVKPE